MKSIGQAFEEAGVDSILAKKMLELMYAIRAFEEKAEELYILGKIHGTMHLSIGMEASAVGSVMTLRPDDLILSTHRGHGHCIAKGADLGKMMAEFMGKECGYCRGRGGSMHIADVEGGNLGANGVVAGGIPLAVGVGIGLKMQKKDQVVMCFFGDGAVNSGPFNEAINMAVIYNLPVVFVCENNQYAMSFPTSKAFATPELSQRAHSYGLPAVTVDGNDILAVFQAVKGGVDRARNGEGPSFIENYTYRWRGHSKSDANRYRTKEEIESWQKKCPISRFSNVTTEQGLLDEDGVEAVRQEAYQRIEDAVAFAESCDEPSLDEIEDGVYT
jgi:acetoin:2,6-dichlorophenolindophenol oxidoreductase subunit alpha